MRRVLGILLLAGLVAVAPRTATGQIDPEYGISLGYNWASLDSPADPGTHGAFIGGLVVRQPLNGPLSVQSELLLHQKGAEVEEEDTGGIAYGAGYIELPILLHLEGPTLGPVALHAEAGGFGAIKIFERQTPASSNLNIALDTGTSFYRRFDAGGVAGLGATISVRDRQLNLTVRRSWGVVDVAREVDDQPFADVPFPETGTTRTLSILLRFGF